MNDSMNKLFNLKKVNKGIIIAAIILLYVLIRLFMRTFIVREGVTAMDASGNSKEKTFSLMEQTKTTELLSPEAIQKKHDDMVKLIDSFENDR